MKITPRLTALFFKQYVVARRYTTIPIAIKIAYQFTKLAALGVSPKELEKSIERVVRNG